MGHTGCPETSVRKYHYSLRDDPEERRSLHTSTLYRYNGEFPSVSVVALSIWSECLSCFENRRRTLLAQVPAELRKNQVTQKRFKFAVPNFEREIVRKQERLSSEVPTSMDVENSPVFWDFLLCSG